MTLQWTTFTSYTTIIAARLNSKIANPFFTCGYRFLLETELGKNGGKFVKAAEPWGAQVCVAGKLITGQNPASASGVGEAIKTAIKA